MQAPRLVPAAATEGAATAEGPAVEGPGVEVPAGGVGHKYTLGRACLRDFNLR